MQQHGLCPVCNGMANLAAVCPNCGGEGSDEGRLGDLYGPYSPYRAIDDVRLTNGFPDLLDGVCLHAAVCRRCGTVFPASVDEQ